MGPSKYDVSLEMLRAEHPRQYRLWVLVGICTVLVGYGASIPVLFAERGLWSTLTRQADAYVFGATLGALGLWWSGRARAAALVPLTTVWLDIHYSILVLGDPARIVELLVIPPLVLGTGLLMGGRAAFLVAAVTAVTMPVVMVLAGVLGLGPGANAPGFLHLVVVVEGVLLATSALLAAFLVSFERILRKSEADAAQRREAEEREKELLLRLQHAQKLEAVGLLAGGVAHDFNNLLTAVAGYGALLQTSSDAEARELGVEIMEVQAKGSSLTRQLLAFARKDVARARPMELGEALGAMEPLVRRMVGEQVRLDLSLASGCRILADPGRIEQVVLNLAANARDAMPGGGTLGLRCVAQGDVVLLEVEDTGVGMSSEVVARVFEPFFTTKGPEQGTGLGLSTVHGIVADSGGTIEVDSRPGEGTKFTIRWPVTDRAVESTASMPAVQPAGGAGQRILVVEDTEAPREFLRRLLSRSGFEVSVAVDGAEALAISQNGDPAPDLVLSDVMMPGMTGPELRHELRPRWPDVPFLFMSGYLGDNLRDLDFDPVEDLINKPFTGPELLARIARKLDDAPPASAP